MAEKEVKPVDNMAILEAYARLKSLRQNVPSHDIEVRFISEFHQILDLLQEGTGVNLARFRVPPSEVKPIIIGGNYLDGTAEYSDESFCGHSYFLMKVDAALNMFGLRQDSWIERQCQAARARRA